ncbi:MAG: phosphoribosylamine--glycine ligase [bacterium]|nr:phosphoribosylamine--glycine ligase [bacterium]
MKTNQTPKVLLVGNSARGHAIAEAIMRSKHNPILFVYMKANNPGIAALAEKVEIGGYDQPGRIAEFAESHDASLAIIDSEEPLCHGVVDALEWIGIPTVGPKQKLAMIETSKGGARLLMAKHHIPGSPKFRIFRTMDGIKDYLKENLPVVLKPDGLTGGKGVMIQGEHFATIAEALKICRDILTKHQAVVIEKKLEGEEFSLQCFCDGRNIVAMPPVQDHKRRLNGDLGLNTGSMGSYSCANHLLPFLTPAELEQAADIVRRTVRALHLETGLFYRGIIYGGFMVTRDGVKLIEFNARFGDPEAINVLALLETDFVDICQAITNGRLHKLPVSFRRLATVVKYVVPFNYGLLKDQRAAEGSDLIKIGNLGKATLYYSSVNHDQAGCHLTSSRAAAVLGTAPGLSEAERIAEKAARAITGAVAHRTDIGTAALIARRVRHMEELNKQK